MGEKKNGNSAYIWLAVMLLVGASLAFFSNMYVRDDFRPYRADILTLHDNRMLIDPYKKVKLKSEGREIRGVWLGPSDSVPFYVNGPKTMRVRMKAYFPELNYSPELRFIINGREAYAFSPGWDGKVAEIEFEMPKTLLNPGENVFGFKAEKDGRAAYEFISLRNYAGISKNFPRAYVAFDSDVVALPFARPFDYLLFTAAMFIAWVLCGNILRASRGAGLDVSLKRAALWHLPFAFIFLGAALFSELTPYILLLHPEPFYVFAFAPSAAIVLFYGVPLTIREFPALLENSSAGLSSVMSSARPDRKRALSTLRLMLRNIGTIAVAGFIVMLTAAGVSMILKRQDVAEKMADIAYFLLVFGVFMRIFELKKEDRQPGEKP